MKVKYDFGTHANPLVAATDNEIELFINAYPNIDIFVTGGCACM